MVNSIIPLTHLVLVHLDYPWVLADRRAHFHLSLQVGLALPFRGQDRKRTNEALDWSVTENVQECKIFQNTPVDLLLHLVRPHQKDPETPKKFKQKLMAVFFLTFQTSKYLLLPQEMV